METTSSKTLAPLVKESSTYKIIIPAKVERLIRFLCERVWDTEWSGVLFYTPTGNFEDGSLEIHCEDILPMDIGSSTYTEFDMSPDVISYMAQNPELLDCKMGLIHSHNNMSTFFSGTDLATLKEEGNDRNHFVSLIVNNEGKYTAAITRKVTYKSVISEMSYEGFDGKVTLPDEESSEETIIEYFYLNITFQEEEDNKFCEVATRLKEIKDAKAKAKPAASTKTPSTYTPGDFDYYRFGDYWKKQDTQPTLFDDLDFETPADYKAAKPAGLMVEKSAKDVITDAFMEKIINQLITGSVTVTKLDKDTKTKLINSMTTRFGNRFGKDDVGHKLFTYWATDFIEFLLWYSVEDPDVDEADAGELIAKKAIEELKKLPQNEFIEEYIKLFGTYVDKL